MEVVAKGLPGIHSSTSMEERNLFPVEAIWGDMVNALRPILELVGLNKLVPAFAFTMKM
jgi:hypothetical protein